MVENSDGVANKLQQKRNKYSVVYNERLKGQARDLSSKEMTLRTLSFLLDAIFMFWPSIIFIVSILLLTSPMNIGGEIIRNTFELSTIYIISILAFNTFSALYFKGQTIGMRYYGLKVVKENLDELNNSQIIIRELVGVSLPWVCILLTYNLMGFSVFFISFLAFVSINFVIIFTDKKHRSLIDMIMHTKLVLLPDEDTEFDVESILEETSEEINEEVTITKVEQQKVEKQIVEENTKEEPIETHPEIDLENPKEKGFDLKKMVPNLKGLVKPKAKDEEIVETVVEPAKEEKLPEQPSKIIKEEKVELPKVNIVEKPKVIIEPKQSIQKPIETPKPIEKKPFQEEVKPLVSPKPTDTKEKSVSEIISEAVSVVDIALESRKKDYSVNIVKPKKPEVKETPKEEPVVEVKPKEEIPQVIQPKEIIEETIQTEPESVEATPRSEKNNFKKNNKKKNGKPQKVKPTKNNVKVKDIKSISSVKKGR